MPATQEQKKQFQTEQKKFKDDIANITKEISLIKKFQKEKPQIKNYLLISEAIEHLKICGLNLALSDISQEILELKNQSILDNARKEVYKVLQSIEEVVTNDPELTLNGNQDFIGSIEQISAGQRLNLLKSLREIVKGMVSRYGANTKWRWSFQEIYMREAVIAKNITDWRKVEQNTDPRKEDYQDLIKLSRYVKDQLFMAAQEYKSKYELADRKTDMDLKNIIKCFESLYIIHNHFGEIEDAERVKTLIEATKDTLEVLLNPDKKKTAKSKK